MTTNQHLAWCAAWNRAILQGKRPIDALKEANQAAEQTQEPTA